MTRTWQYPHAVEHGVPVELLATLAEAIGEYLLIGSYARDVVSRGVLGMTLTMPRTRDLDVAVAVRDTAESYRRLVQPSEGSSVSRLQFRVPDLPEIPIDVIPYVNLLDLREIPVGTGRDDERTLDATGMAEAAACALSVDLAGKLVLRVPPLHALIALKLLAYGLRVELGETKDARDLALLFLGSQRSYEDCHANSYLAPSAMEHAPDRVGPWPVGVRIRREFGPAITDRIDSATRHPLLPGLLRTQARGTWPSSIPSSLDWRTLLADLRSGFSDLDAAAETTDPEPS